MNKQDSLKKWLTIGNQPSIVELSTARIKNHGEEFAEISRKGLQSFRKDSNRFLQDMKAIKFSH